MTLRRPIGLLSLRHAVAALCLALLVFAGTGCQMFQHEMPRPGRTHLDSRVVVVPAQLLSNYLVIEAKWDKRGPYHFLVDTGASVTLVSPELASRYAAKDAPAPATPLVRVKSAEGETALLTATTLRKLVLGGAKFEDVQALIYDCSELSAHLGVKIDGILGFPLFRETLLTLDYPQSRVVLRRRTLDPQKLPGSTIAFNNERKTPIIPLRIGEQNIAALIDSGSDAALSLNPFGLQPQFAVNPRPGATLATLGEDKQQKIGRLSQPLVIGAYTVEQPLVDITDELTSVGGGILKQFTVTFDQDHSRVTFFREAKDPIPPTPFRSIGLSFSKTPAYWRVASVIPNSPAEAAGVQRGDLVTRINGQPVSAWGITRYQELIARADEASLTFLNGNQETEKRLKIFDLVP